MAEAVQKYRFQFYLSSIKRYLPRFFDVKTR